MLKRIFVTAALASAITIACSGDDTSTTDAGADAQVGTDTGAVDTDSGTADSAVDTAVSDTGLGVSTSCSALPSTVTLGASISVNTFGAVLCYNNTSAACRLTTNTYSDGPEPCPSTDSMLVFLSAPSAYSVNAGGSWMFESASVGTLAFSNKTVKDIPVSTAVTAVVSDGTNKKKVVFQFNGGSSFTMTSFGTP